MAWVIMNNAKVLKDSETGALGIRCGCGGEIIKVGNAWQDVTGDFEWDERIIPEYCAMLAGNNVLQVTAEALLTEAIGGTVQIFKTDKWVALIEGNVPIMVLHGNGTINMIMGTYNAYGYVEADLSDVTEFDKLYMSFVVPVE